MPFWKKTDKGGKKKPPKPAVPRTAQQLTEQGWELLPIMSRL